LSGYDSVFDWDELVQGRLWPCINYSADEINRRDVHRAGAYHGGVFTVGFIAALLLMELARHDTGIVAEPGLRLRKTGMGLCSFQVD
jgi:hypothetical protein